MGNIVLHDDTLLEPEQYPEELKRWYKAVTGKELDLDNPRTYNEKIQWIKLFGVTPEMKLLTDKYAVRDWVAERIGEKYLIPVLGVWNRIEDIEFAMLPEKFVLKCTHGCAMNTIVRNKELLNVEGLRKQYEIWLKTNFALRGGLQLQYKDIPPRIIAEEYLENADGDLYDYKFWYFDGKLQYIMFLSERETGLKMDFFDAEWNHLPFTYNYPNSDKVIPRPQKLEDMIAVSEKLAKGFPHVRVDLYQLNDGTIKFGEMTFTSCNGICCWSDESVDLAMGDMISLERNN